MFIVTPETVLNPSALETRRVPRRFLGRVSLWPAGGGLGLWLRVLLEIELWRYLLALVPFAVAAVVWPDYAIGIAQAPLPMLLVVYLVESRLLRVPKDRRAALMDRAGIDRGLDLLRDRGQRLLARIAAGRGLAEGRLHLVVEQSDMWRVPPLTYVSVQAEDGPVLLRLTRADLEPGCVLVRDMKHPGEKDGNHVWVDVPHEAEAIARAMPKSDPVKKIMSERTAQTLRKT